MGGDGYDKGAYGKGFGGKDMWSPMGEGWDARGPYGKGAYDGYDAPCGKGWYDAKGAANWKGAGYQKGGCLAKGGKNAAVGDSWDAPDFAYFDGGAGYAKGAYGKDAGFYAPPAYGKDSGWKGAKGGSYAMW